MIHQYRLNGYNIVLDVNSGAVHLMDDLSFDLLDMLGDPIPESCPGEAFDRFTPQYAREEVEDAFRELLALQKADQLCSSDDYDQFAKLDDPVAGQGDVLTYCARLQPAVQILLRGHGRILWATAMLMSLEVGKAAIDYLIEYSCGATTSRWTSSAANR